MYYSLCTISFSSVKDTISVSTQTELGVDVASQTVEAVHKHYLSRQGKYLEGFDVLE